MFWLKIIQKHRAELKRLSEREKEINKMVQEEMDNKMKIRVKAKTDSGMLYGCEHHSQWQTQPCKECEYENRMSEGYNVGEKLKIKMPKDWDKDDKLLTRQEAIEIYKRIIPVNKFHASEIIDSYVALGMLKLKGKAD